MEKGRGGSSPGWGTNFSQFDAVGMQAHRSSGFQAQDVKTQGGDIVGQKLGRRLVGPAGGIGGGADIDAPGQKGPGADDHRVGGQDFSFRELDAANPAIGHHDLAGNALVYLEPRNGFQETFQMIAVGDLVVLGPGGPHRRPLAAIEHFEMNAGGVGGPGHHPAQRVDLLDQVPLGDAADGRVAGHLGQGFQMNGQQGGFGAHPGRGISGFNPRVPGADDDDLHLPMQNWANMPWRISAELTAPVNSPISWSPWRISSAITSAWAAALRPHALNLTQVLQELFQQRFLPEIDDRIGGRFADLLP